MRPTIATSLIHRVAALLITTATVGAQDGAHTGAEVFGLVQQRVENVWAQPESERVEALTAIEEELADVWSPVSHDSKGALEYNPAYWTAYVLYRKSVALMSGGQFEQGRGPLHQAVTILERIETRDADVLALLGLASGLYLAYVPRHRIIVATDRVNETLSGALRMAPNNLRVLYANAIADFNTPEVYGGGKQVERLLSTALALPDQEPVGSTPQWGRREATMLLIRFYVDQERSEDARRLVDKARSQWPASPEMRRLAESAMTRE